MQKDFKLKVGDVVQLGPNVENPIFAYSIMIISEPKAFGAQGYIQGIQHEIAYYRATWEEMEFIGKLHWISED